MTVDVLLRRTIRQGHGWQEADDKPWKDLMRCFNRFQRRLNVQGHLPQRIQADADPSSCIPKSILAIVVREKHSDKCPIVPAQTWNIGIPQSTACNRILRGMSYITQRDVRHVCDECIEKLFESVSQALNEISQSLNKKSLDNQQCESKCLDILSKLKHIGGDRWKPSWIQAWHIYSNYDSFPFVEPTVFSRMTLTECYGMDPIFLLKTTLKQRQAITPHCFAEFMWGNESVTENADDFRRLFTSLKPSMMSQLYKPLPPIFGTLLNGEQFKRVPPYQCQKMSLELLPNATLRKITPDCLKNYISKRAIDKSPLNWNGMPRRTFGMAIDGGDMVERLTLEDWKVMPGDMFLMAARQFPELCQHLGVPEIKAKHPLPPSYCAPYLSHEHFLEVLERQKSTLSTEYFGLITAETVKAFPNGFDTLIDMHLKAHQWSALGERAPDSDHPCSLITEPNKSWTRHSFKGTCHWHASTTFPAGPHSHPSKSISCTEMSSGRCPLSISK